MNNEVKFLSPFKRMCITIGNLPTAYIESMSYYEGLTFLVNYLANNVIPAVNTNSEAVKELQEKYIELKSYVDNYFESLDVQEEVNNKLDEMADNGQLTDIIAQYLGLAGILVYSSVADMKAAENLADGSKVETYGYYSLGDGGGAKYNVREVLNTDVLDDMFIIALHDPTLVAELIVDKTLNVKQIGAKGDGVSDDTNVILKAIEHYHVGTDATNQNYDTVLLANYPNAGGTIYFPKGVYCISSTLKIPCYVDIDLGYSTLKAISGGSFDSDYMIAINSTDLNTWTYAYVPRIGFFINGKLDGNSIANIKGIFTLDPHKFENLEFRSLYKCIFYKGQYIDNIYINSITIESAMGTDYMIEKTSSCDCLFINNIHIPVYNNNSQPVNGIRMLNGHSGKIQNIINGSINLFSTEDYTIENWHCENGSFLGEWTTNTVIKNSNIYVRNNTPITLAGETTNNNNRASFLENVGFIYYLSIDQYNYDTKDIDISKYYQQLFVKGCYRYQWTEGIQALAPCGITIYDGSNTLLNPYDEAEIYNRKIRVQNSYCRRDGNIIFGVNTNSYVNWNLPTGTYYYIALNLCDVPKLCGKTGSEVSGTTSSADTGFKLSIANDLGKGNTLRIFRGTASGVYTAYVDIPNPKTVNLYDNGYSINGYKWITINSSDVVTTTNGIAALNRTDIFDKVLVKGYGYGDPSVGTWKQGDIIERQNPYAGGNCGWICTAEGTPGTWKSFGTISS